MPPVIGLGFAFVSVASLLLSHDSMSTASLLSAGLLGIDAYPIHVEVDIARGLPGWSTVGLPESAVREAKERVISAIHNGGYQFPFRRITLNLAPADVKKQGSAFDLPIAVGLLAAAELLPVESLKNYCLLGELSLSGQLRPIRGAISVAMLARRQGWKGLILPLANAGEARWIEGLHVWGARDLPEVVEFLSGRGQLQAAPEPNAVSSKPPGKPANFSEVTGQAYAKRALEVAAAGFHHVLMVGPPGSGKSLLATCLPSILPPMTFEESLATTRVYSLIGLLGTPNCLIQERPFRSPHHTISDAGLIGGGSFPKPGEISLAHNGVLFLDELTEFKRNVLESLRQPLETHAVMISRAQHRLGYPARFLLAAAMNPCPCGQLGNPRALCRCPAASVERYQAKLSGPLLDRFDLKIEVPALSFGELRDDGPAEPSESIRERVLAAHGRQRKRLASEGLIFNSQMGPREIRKFCRLKPDGEKLLELAVKKWELSARSFHRTLKVARTIADLAESEGIEAQHIGEAIGYRQQRL